jgi:hypothetical protein
MIFASNSEMIDMFFDLLNLILPFELSLCNKYRKGKIITDYEPINTLPHPPPAPPLPVNTNKDIPDVPDPDIISEPVAGFVGVVVLGARTITSFIFIDPVTVNDPEITALPEFAAKTSFPENLYEYTGIFYMLIIPLVKRSSHQYMI